MDSNNPNDGAIRDGDPPYHASDGRDAERRLVPEKGSKRRSAFYETVACLMALGGVLMFGFGIFPCINPIQFRLDFGPAYLPASLFSLPASILIMWIAWRLSREAQNLKRGEEKKG